MVGRLPPLPGPIDLVLDRHAEASELGQVVDRAARGGELAERSKRHGELAARIAQLEEDWLWNSAAMEAEVNRARD